MHAKITMINSDRGLRFEEFKQELTPNTTKTELYNRMMREYGRPVSKVYVGEQPKDIMAIGWVFQKRVPYDDGPGTFLQETWVVVENTQAVNIDTWKPSKNQLS